MAAATPKTLSDALLKFLSLTPDFFILVRRSYDDWFFKQYYRNFRKKVDIKNQKVSLQEHQTFGSDLAVSRFVIDRCNGKVRDINGTWISKYNDLPKSFQKNFKITYIDASNSGLITEGIDNFMLLDDLESIDLSKNKELDDFACDQLSRQFRTSNKLKEVNLSFNPYISIYGLDILFRIPSIKRICAVETMASSHEQIEVFKAAAAAERNCEVVV